MYRFKLTHCVIAIVFAVAMFALFGRKSTADIPTLLDTALTSSDNADRIASIRTLGSLGPPGLPALRNVTTHSDVDDCTALAVLHLSRQLDYESTDLIIDLLESDSQSVRSTAAVALRELLGRDYHFPVTGSLDKRNAVIHAIRKDWISLRQSKLFEFNSNRLRNQDGVPKW